MVVVALASLLAVLALPETRGVDLDPVVDHPEISTRDQEVNL